MTSVVHDRLAPYAVPTEGLLGRTVSEPPDETRTPFQRDRDRIIHTQAFRRLQGKTQVFVAGEGDHYRTRLTHTMEVAQIGRDIARTLGLNEDLSECIALAHDLGHPPFGHAGEMAINEWLSQFGKLFEHNEQSLRVVATLEEHSSQYKGLNLNMEVLEGLQKHRQSTGAADFVRGLSLEAQVVNLSDEIAYIGHDCEDGMRAGFFSLEEVSALPLAEEAWQPAQERGTALHGALIHTLVHDLYAETNRLLQEQGIKSLDGVYTAPNPLVGFSATMQHSVKELRQFLQHHLYEHPSVEERNREGQAIVRTLCDAYFKNPPEKILDLQKRTASTLEEAVKDYVAGMTDQYAKIQSERV